MDFNAALGLIIAGFIVPFLTALFNRPEFTPERKRVVTWVVSVVVGVVAALGTGAIQGVPGGVTEWVVRIVCTVGIVLGLGQGFHQVLKDATDPIESHTPLRASDG